jgi:hypothetical protein
MQAGYQLRTGVITGTMVPGHDVSLETSSVVGFLTDSKSLSNFLKRYVSLQRPPMPPDFEIGRERAFTDMPDKFKALQPEAARRKL